MKPPVPMPRGTVFRAEHDSTYELWVRDEPRKKFGVVFNQEAVRSPDDTVYYFICTSDSAKFRENPQLHTDCFIVPKGRYSFWRHETAIDFTVLWTVPLKKLMSKLLHVYEERLTLQDVSECEKIIRTARVLPQRERKLIGLG